MYVDLTHFVCGILYIFWGFAALVSMQQNMLHTRRQLSKNFPFTWLSLLCLVEICISKHRPRPLTWPRGKKTASILLLWAAGI